GAPAHDAEQAGHIKIATKHGEERHAVADARVGCTHAGQLIADAERDDADVMGIHARPVLQELERLHHGLTVARRDLELEERRGPDIYDDDALARKRLCEVDELRYIAVITSAHNGDDGLAPAGDQWRWRGRLVDVQKDRAIGRGNRDAL